MRRVLIYIAVSIVLLIAGAWAYPGIAYYIKGLPPPAPDALKQQMISSIKNPFPQADTMLLETEFGGCGQTPKYNRPIVFEMGLDSLDGRNKLSQYVGLPVEDFVTYAKMASKRRTEICKEKYDSSYVDNYELKKVFATIYAVQINSKTIILYERYNYSNEIKLIHKQFTFSGGKWVYKITLSK